MREFLLATGAGALTTPLNWRAIASMDAETCLIGDIGGTNARFALARPGQPGYTAERVYACADHPSLEQGIEAYFRDVGLRHPGTICLAVAGPVLDSTVQFTNSHWQIAERPLRNRFEIERVRLINDFAAIAHGLPLLGEHDLLRLGGPPPPDLSRGNYRLGVLGPGTGLGAAGLMHDNGLSTVLVTEAGHVGFAPETPEQRQLLARLQTRFERVSDERVASGAGLENIYWALRRPGDPSASAAEIFERAAAGQTPAGRAVDLFFELLGQIAGNLALSMGAFQGIYIAGGIVQRHRELLRTSRFRAGFENKGRHHGIMARVPTVAIRHPQPGLLGASRVAMKMLAFPG